MHEQIDLIRPKVLVALGATAVEGLLGKTAGITKLRGTWHAYRGIPPMPTYHPAYLLRNQAMSEKRRVWERGTCCRSWKNSACLSATNRGIFSKDSDLVKARKALIIGGTLVLIAVLVPIIHHYQLRAATNAYIADLKAKGEPMDVAWQVSFRRP